MSNVGVRRPGNNWKGAERINGLDRRRRWQPLLLQSHETNESFDCACRSLLDIGPLDKCRKEVIARRIIEAACNGERDPKKLCEHAREASGVFSRKVAWCA